MEMMPVIRLSDSTFEQLRVISKWLSKNTPSDTIDALVREKANELGLGYDQEVDDLEDGLLHQDIIQFEKTPGLSFTKLIEAKINGAAVKKPNWANLLSDMAAAVKAKGLSEDRLVKELQIQTKSGSYTSAGFQYFPALGISIQGQSAQEAWREVERLAKKWGIPVEIKFQWRQNERALHPGAIGLLRAGAK